MSVYNLALHSVAEDCQVLAAVVGLFEGEGKPEGQPTDIPTVLQAYNDRRLDNAHAVCELSEEGMGGGRSMRPAFMAQLFVVVFLNKTLGRLFPKVRSSLQKHFVVSQLTRAPNLIFSVGLSTCHVS